MITGIVLGIALLFLCVFAGGVLGGRIGGQRGCVLAAALFFAGLFGLAWFTLFWR